MHHEGHGELLSSLAVGQLSNSTISDLQANDLDWPHLAEIKVSSQHYSKQVAIEFLSNFCTDLSSS